MICIHSCRSYIHFEVIESQLLSSTQALTARQACNPSMPRAFAPVVRLCIALNRYAAHGYECLLLAIASSCLIYTASAFGPAHYLQALSRTHMYCCAHIFTLTAIRKRWLARINCIAAGGGVGTVGVRTLCSAY